MAVGCMLAVTSCGAEPELDFAVAEANLKLAGYSVNSRVFEDDVERVKTLSASKEISDDFKEQIVITEYADATLAKLAIERNTGARGLRSIMENLMMSVMYDIPSRDNVASVIIGADCVNGLAAPQLVEKELVSLDNSIAGSLE